MGKEKEEKKGKGCLDAGENEENIEESGVGGQWSLFKGKKKLSNKNCFTKFSYQTQFFFFFFETTKTVFKNCFSEQFLKAATKQANYFLFFKYRKHEQHLYYELKL